MDLGQFRQLTHQFADDTEVEICGEPVTHMLADGPHCSSNRGANRPPIFA